MAFTSYQSVLDAINGGYRQDIIFGKNSITTTASNWFSLRRATGYPDDPGALSSAGNTCDSSTPGALPYRGNIPGKTMNLLSVGAGGVTSQMFAVYDRLWNAGPLSMSTSTQTITGAQSPSRYTNGIGNNLFVEVANTVGGETAVTMTVSYTNENGTPGRTATIPINTVATINAVHFATLQHPDLGIQSVQSYECTSSGSRTWNLVMYNRNMFTILPYYGGGYVEHDLMTQYSSLPIIQDNACLSFLMFVTAAASGQMFGKISMVQG